MSNYTGGLEEGNNYIINGYPSWGMDYIVTEYVHSNREKWLKNKLLNEDISFDRATNYKWLSDIHDKWYRLKDNSDLSCAQYDYSIALTIYTPNGEYGYSKVDVYLSDVFSCIIIKYEYQRKGCICSEILIGGAKEEDIISEWGTICKDNMKKLSTANWYNTTK